MIILDTNVVSEPMRPNGNPAVIAWLDQQMVETLYLTATSLAELMVGVAILPQGKRKSGLGAMLQEQILNLFETRLLPFDRLAAIRYAEVVGRARAQGVSVSFGDGQIAAIASVLNFTVATRDTAPFIACGIPVINPWNT
jgi:toxin FitB